MKNRPFGIEPMQMAALDALSALKDMSGTLFSPTNNALSIAQKSNKIMVGNAFAGGKMWNEGKASIHMNNKEEESKPSSNFPFDQTSSKAPKNSAFEHAISSYGIKQNAPPLKAQDASISVIV